MTGIFKGLSRWLGVLASLCVLMSGSTPVLAQSVSYTITARVENSAQGDIAPSGVVFVPGGGSQTFVVTANSGYKVSFLQVDGKSQGAISTFTFTGVSANHTIAAGFAPTTYAITVTSGPNGVVSPSSLLRIQSGESQTFTIVPNAGYRIAEVSVDSTPQGPIDSYSFADIQNDHSIVVSFTALNPGGDQDAPPQPEGPGITDLTGLISGDGVFMSSVTAVSGDNRVSVIVNRGTPVRLGGGPAPSKIEIASDPQLPAPPDLILASKAYDLRPEGTTFDLMTTIQMLYDPASVPAGVAENELAIATWDRKTGNWTVVGGSIVQSDNHTVSAPLGRFSPCAVVAPRRAAAFMVKDLEILPKSLRPGDAATVSVTVTNRGGSAGTFQVVLKVDGSVNSTRDVTLAAGMSEKVEFSVRAAVAGSFAVSVEDLSGAFAVVPAVSLPPASPVDWFLVAIIASIVGVGALVGVLILLLLRRNPRLKPRPASFTVKDLEISPRELRLGNKATVAATVTNGGGHAGTFRVMLKIEGLISTTKDVTLAGGTSDRVEFAVTGSAAGSFAVNVAGLTGTLTVVEAPATAASPVNRSEFAAGLF